MPINVLAFHSDTSLYGRHNPPRKEDEVRRATIASGDRTMRSIKRYLADGKKAIVRAFEMGSSYRVTITSELREGVLYSGIARDGEPFRVGQKRDGDEWWFVLSSGEIGPADALPGYVPIDGSMVCTHDERYLAERFEDETKAWATWAAAEQVARERDVVEEEPVRPSAVPGVAPHSWTYCEEVLSPLLAEAAGDKNGALPSAVILAALQALHMCSSGETKNLIRHLIGDRWSSDMRPFDILGFSPSRWCSAKYVASISTSLWTADRLQPADECENNLSSLGVERKPLQGTEADGTRIAAWIGEKTLGNFRPQVELDPLTEFVTVSAMFFKDSWNDPFEREDGEEGVFFGNDGPRSIDFMRALHSGPISRFDRCKVASLHLTTGASVAFVLPNRGVDLADLVASGEAVSAAASHTVDFSYGHGYDVDWWLPKFDVKGATGGSAEKLIPGIEDMEHAPDFSPLVGARESLVPQCSYEARVKIDEDGIEASGYAMFAVPEAGLPDEDPPVIPFIVDRPFAFVLVSSTKEPMFIGMVNRPEGY